MLGILDEHLGELDGARAVFRRAVELGDASMAAWAANNLGFVLTEIGNLSSG